MCLIAFAWQAHPRYALIVVGNRDEFLERPTASAAWSADGRHLAGVDLRGGGTWMGVSAAGRFAALTNYRDPAAMRTDAPTRGRLCLDVLDLDRPMDATLAGIAAEAPRYNGFNLLAAEWGRPASGLWIVESARAARVRAVPAGVHAVSNALLDTPWPKVERAKADVADAIAAGLEADALVDHLLETLADTRLADDRLLPSTGVALATERALSAAFIRLPHYGTRSSTVLLVDVTGEVTFVERRHDPENRSESRFAFATAPVSAARASGR